MVCIYNGLLLSLKKKKILPFVTTWIDLEEIMLNKISQTEKEKYYIALLQVESKTKKKLNS